MSKIRNGTIAEMIVVSELLKEGLSVYLPINHDSKIDILADNSNRIFRIQVKKAFSMKEHNEKMARYIEVRRRTDKIPVLYNKQDFDFCIACDIITNECWIIPIDVFLQYKAGLKLDTNKILEYRKKWSLLKS